jgi:integrase
VIWKETAGAKPWKARILDVDGRKRMRSFQTKAQRDAWVRHVAEQRARLNAGMDVVQGPITYEDLCLLYLDSRPQQTSSEWFEGMLAHSREAFGQSLVRAIRPEEIGRWLHGLHKAPKTKTHILTAFRQALRAGVEWGYLSRNPARAEAVKSPGQKPVRKINPLESWDDVAAIANKIDSWYSPLVRFACATGLRPSELTELRWADLDIQGKTAHIRGTKTRAADRTIYLSHAALDALSDLATQLDRTKPVFAGRRGGKMDWQGFRTNHWFPALAKLGMERRTPGQMRHTFATLALQNGVPIETVSKLMGHESIEITMRHYARWTLPLMERARALLDQFDQPREEQSGHFSDTQAPQTR